MYSTAQVVLVLDLSNFVSSCSSESEIEHHIAKIKLVCLKLLLNFGAKTEHVVEGVRWSWKFYDSRTFRPDTSRKQFLDLGRKTFGEFGSELNEKYCKAFDNQEEGDEPSECRRPHSFVLKKALQEVLLDYNWDGPDISSPVKTTRRKNNGSMGTTAPPPTSGAYNTVVVVANLPRHSHTPSQESPEEFLANVLDATMVKAFQEDNKISLNFIELWEDTNILLPSRLGAELAKLSGSIHNITDYIQTQAKQVAKTQDLSTAVLEGSQNADVVCSQQVQLPWRSARMNRPRKPQPGPTLVWEDASGISYLSIQLQVLAVYGSSSRGWDSAAVVGVVHTNQVALLALAQETASLYMCVAACETFGALVTVLATHQLSLMLRLSGGSLALLSPWGEGAGCLALVSASGLAALAPDMPECSASTLQFVSAAVRRCLKSAAPHAEEETTPSQRWFSASMVQCWFKPVPYPALPTLCGRNKLTGAPRRRAMLERLQKRYRPQIPQPLATGETGPLDLVDITQPPVESQPSQATLAKPTMTRAQQLLKKSHIVTAQQRVKEQLAEEEERVQATERRAAQACERALKSQALETQVLNTVSDPQNERELVQSLIDLRETAGMEADIFTTAQTIINLALVHVKNTTITPAPAAATMQEGLDRVLGYGVLQSAAEILHRPQQETHLHQYKLQTLLRLELLWVLGYSACSKQSEGREEEEEEEEVRRRKEHHVEEVIRLLRAISLHHDPSTMAKFLQETILENYLETLGEVLLEVYEELNQPLPHPLRDIAGDLQSIQSNWLPSSVKSQGSATQYSESPAGSGENPGSGRSKEDRRQRLRPHPSLQEANKRSIVVPKITRAISRTLSEQVKSCSGQPGPSAAGTAAESSGAPVKNVCRNLFVLGEPSHSSVKSNLQKSHHHPSQNTTPKKASTLVSRTRQPSHITPVKKTTLRSTTPRFKAGSKVLIPETPENKVGSTVFNHNRCHKSMGTTCIGESPDLKMSCRELSKTTPRRLRASLTAARRNSFYSGASGARSRNWERARAQLLADHIKGHADRRPSESGSQQSSVNSGFLFSNIVSTDQILSPSPRVNSTLQTSKQTMTPDKSTLYPDLHTTDNNASQIKDGNSITANLTVGSPTGGICVGVELKNENQLAASMDLGHTPVKRVRRALLLSTPSKAYLRTSRSPEREVNTPASNATDFSGFSTPVKNSSTPLVCEVSQDPVDSMVSQPDDTEYREVFHTTQSKKVQFTLKLSPNAPQTPKRSGTPKSILKTPNKTPLKSLYHSPLINRKQDGSWRREDAAVTPCKHASQEDVVHPSNPVVKVGDLVSHTEHELELLSPSKSVTQPLDLYPKKSLKLVTPQKSSSHPKKSRNSPSKLNTSPVTFFSSDRKLAKRLENASSNYIADDDSTVKLDEIDVSLLPDMPVEDINLVNSLLFGAVEAPDSEIPVLELSENSYLLEHPANHDDFEVYDSDDDDDGDNASLFLYLPCQPPDLEATVASHITTETYLDSGCMSPILLLTGKEWYNHRADSGGGVVHFAGEKEVFETNTALCGMTPKEVVSWHDVHVADDTDSAHNLTESSCLSEDVTEDRVSSVTEDSGPIHSMTQYSADGVTGSSCDLTGDTDSSHYVSEDTNISVDVGVDVWSSQNVAMNNDSLQDVAENSNSSLDVAENTASSREVDEHNSFSHDMAHDTGSSQSVDEGTESSQSVDEGTEFSQSVDEDADTSQSVDEDTGASQSVAENKNYLQSVNEDTGSSQSVDEDTGASRDVDKKTGSLQGVDEDTDTSQSVDEDTGTSQSVAENKNYLQSVAEDTGSSQSVDKDTGSSESVDEDADTSQSVAEDTGSLQGVDEDTDTSQSVDEDTGSSQNVDKKTGSLQGVDGDTNISHNVQENTSSSLDEAEKTHPAQEITENCSSSDIVEEDVRPIDVSEDIGSSQDGAEISDSSQCVAQDDGTFHDVPDGVGSNNEMPLIDFSCDRVKDRNTSFALNVNKASTSVLTVTQDGCSVVDTAGDGCAYTNSKDANAISIVKEKEESSLGFGARYGGNSSVKVEKDLTFSNPELVTASSKMNKHLLEASDQEKEVSETQKVIHAKESLSKSSKMVLPPHKRAVKKHQKGKRNLSTNSEEEPNQTINQENVSRRRILRKRIRRETVRKPREAVVRACRKLAHSVQEMSSDDSEDQRWHQQNLKRKFDNVVIPEKNKVGETTLPLKNVENLPHTPNKSGYIDSASEDSKFIPATNVPDTGDINDTLESVAQQKHSVNGVSDLSETLQEHCGSPLFLKNTSLRSAGTKETNRVQQGKLRKKSKGVKLTLTRSGDQYQVTKTQISRCSSDPSSSGDLDLNLSCSDYNDNLDSSKSSIPGTSGQLTKKRKSTTLLTPHRFTRHMSRDISVSPEVYQQLITLSPQRLSKKLKIDAVMSKEKNGNNIMGQPIHASTPRHPGKSDEWMVSNSPTPTKTFVRRQKQKHQINVSPRVNMPRMQQASPSCEQSKEEADSNEDWSPLFLKKKRVSYSTPSIQSLLHLSSDKILLDQSPNTTRKDSSVKRRKNIVSGESSVSPSPSKDGKLRSSRRLLYSTTAK